MADPWNTCFVRIFSKDRPPLFGQRFLAQQALDALLTRPSAAETFALLRAVGVSPRAGRAVAPDVDVGLVFS